MKVKTKELTCSFRWVNLQWNLQQMKWMVFYKVQIREGELKRMGNGHISKHEGIVLRSCVR